MEIKEGVREVEKTQKKRQKRAVGSLCGWPREVTDIYGACGVVAAFRFTPVNRFAKLTVAVTCAVEAALLVP